MVNNNFDSSGVVDVVSATMMAKTVPAIASNSGSEKRMKEFCACSVTWAIDGNFIIIL